MDLELDGKVTLVTGGARGIGRACVEAFAREGARMAILDRNVELLAETEEAVVALGADVLTIETDVSNSRSVDDAHSRVIEHYGGIDIGFNNAGIITASRAIEDTSEEDWDRVIAVDLKGLWLCVRAQVRHMRARNVGVIVNTASNVSFIGAPGATPYVAAKHGVLGITRTVALELAGTNVRVNAVAPGTVTTPMAADLAGDFDPFADAPIRRQLPIGRNGTTDEIADTVLWLASPRSSFALGSTMIVDGGFTAQ
jgi:NAD(P)-dependent dehydrogenase (short-subunit alcohol dehydrogenase family)